MTEGQPPSKPDKPTKGVYRRIFRHMAAFWPGIAFTTACGVVGSVFTVLQPWPIKMIIDGVLVADATGVDLGPLSLAAETTADKLRAVAVLAGIYMGVVLGSTLCGAAGMYAIIRVALRMIHSLRGQLVTHMSSLSLRYHANQSVGDSIWRAINDAREIQQVMLYGLRTFTTPIFRLVAMVGLMFVLDATLTIVAICVAPPLIFAIRRITTRIQAASMESRDRMGELTGLIERTLVAIRAVQVFGREGREHDNFAATSNKFINAQLRFRTWEQLLNIATVLITGVGSAAVLLLAARSVVNGNLTIGAMFIFVEYMRSLYQMVQEIMFVYGPFQDAVVGVSRAFAVLDEKPDIEEAPDAVAKDSFEHEISFGNVWHEYEAERPVLRDVNLAIARGEKVAIVGETGSGKTTLLNLIPRLYDVTGGAIEVDGIDVRRLKIASLRSLISMVPQEPMLFSASVKENILYGRMDASDDDVRAAARAARAEDFVEALPQGFDTPVGERGVKLSTGQQQRISIARAFLKDSPILLLDEPTSALDLNTEADFIDGLTELMAGRTVFIVAHRLSTIRNVDRIFVLDSGAVVEAGTHDELVAARGHYHSLYMRQFATASTDADPTVG
jgi:ABC-type multidrug transport system fused ATPase/permease subunit